MMEYLERCSETDDYFFRLGQGLAELHRISSERFGFPDSNYIGSLVQTNAWHKDWHEFFVSERLEPLVRWCFDEKHFHSGLHRSFGHLFSSLREIFPPEKPSLLHGDLWSGNKMNTVSGPSIFDPAVYYGHREMDIAMTKLFGGFSPAFYEAYNASFPLEKGYEKRTEICNLYPLLVHVKLFGTGYLTDVLQTVKRF